MTKLQLSNFEIGLSNEYCQFNELGPDSQEEPIQFDGYLYLDPNHTIRKKTARLLERITREFPDQVFLAIPPIDEEIDNNTLIKR